MLTGVSRGTTKSPRVVLYGPAKIGKTTWGASFPVPIIVGTEDGAEGLAVDRFPVAESWQNILDNLAQIATGDHKYETCVLDTLGGAAELAARYICSKLFNDDFGPKGFAAFGQGMGATSEEMRRLLPILDSCRDRGMTVILLAHTGVQSVRNPVEGDFQRYAPEMDRRVWSRFARWADVIGRADFEYVVLKKDGSQPGPGRAKGTNTRIIHWSGSAAEDAGTRAGFEMPDQTLLSYDAFAEALGRGTPTITEVQALWHLLDSATAKKTIAWLGVEKIQDASSSKLKELLNRLRALEAEKNEKEAVNA